MRDDLPLIINLAREMGFEHIQVNTNGLRIAEDTEYLKNLKQSGASLIYLQFDGFTDDVYQSIRGKNLLKYKFKTIENCAKVKLGVMLVPTLISGVNDDQIGELIHYAIKKVPVVKGILFQPVSYFGRYPRPPKDEDRITVPDILEAIEDQTNGIIKKDSFIPRKRKESYCAFSGSFFLTIENRLIPMTNYIKAKEAVCALDSQLVLPAEQSRKFINKQWRFIDPSSERKENNEGSLQSLLERIKTHSFSISCKPFQDAWNIDLERLKRCCVHVISADKRRVPLCIFYCTGINGRRLYGNVP